MDLSYFYQKDEQGQVLTTDSGHPRQRLFRHHASRADVERQLQAGKPLTVITATAERAIETDQWRWFDAYLAWQVDGEALAAKAPAQARDEQGAFVADDPDTPADEAWVGGYSPEAHQAALDAHAQAEPVRPPIPEVNDYLAACAGWEHHRKLAGVEFDGVMCSATKEDMWGLNSVEGWIRSGASTPFRFDNGTVLTLTPENIDAFQAVWIPFRASFFS